MNVWKIASRNTNARRLGNQDEAMQMKHICARGKYVMAIVGGDVLAFFDVFQHNTLSKKERNYAMKGSYVPLFFTMKIKNAYQL